MGGEKTEVTRRRRTQAEERARAETSRWPQKWCLFGNKGQMENGKRGAHNMWVKAESTDFILSVMVSQERIHLCAVWSPERYHLTSIFTIGYCVEVGL